MILKDHHLSQIIIITTIIHQSIIINYSITKQILEVSNLYSQHNSKSKTFIYWQTGTPLTFLKSFAFIKIGSYYWLHGGGKNKINIDQLKESALLLEILQYRVFQYSSYNVIMLQLFKCEDACCGFITVIIGAICYGSYGDPIKATSSINAHPLVVQSYKTFVVFTASFIVFLAEEQPRWTSYGLLSGLFWVCGGTLGILAIQNAGIATLVRIWSIMMVMINFVWGILVFQKPVHLLWEWLSISVN